MLDGGDINGDQISRSMMRDMLFTLQSGGMSNVVLSENAGKDGSSNDSASAGGAGAAAGAPDPDDEDSKPTRITNPKHHPNSQSPEPKNVDELFNNSVPDKNGVRWAKDAEGNIHRFSKPSNGETHWNGSTTGIDPMKPQNIPYIKKILGFKG